MNFRIFPNQTFIIGNSIGLTVLFVFTWARASSNVGFENVIYWPGAYFLSVWLLSQFTYQLIFETATTSARFSFKKHLLSGLAFGALHLLLSGLLTILLERFFRLTEHYTLFSFGSFLTDHWHYGIDGVLWYTAYLAISWLVRLSARLEIEKKRVAVLKSDLRNADLKKLRNELNPHFLFNTMNGIAMKVRLGESKVAVNMIAALNDLLRLALTKGGSRSVPLSEELELLDKYLTIERTRFDEEVQIEINIEEEVMSAKVPQLILQPLVENAFKHGVKENIIDQVIRITGSRENEHLVMTVFNTSKNHTMLIEESSGIGLPNTIQRLRQLYGTNFRFQSNMTKSGVAFTITIPFQIS
ncbi:MAG: histidine kinase [Marinoscillum sp.]